MNEHVIRFRGGWTDGSARLGLPADWTESDAIPTRLERAFQAPPLRGRESLWLRLDAVAGLLCIRLNGMALHADSAAEGLEIRLAGLLPRGNRLELEIDPACVVVPTGGWGHVALVIREISEPGPRASNGGGT